jgi:DNA primase
MPGIPDATISEVRAASDLVDVVSDRVRLKKQGQRFVGLCPFHNEKSPSFSVDAGQNLYYCFGCRRGGDVFKFVEEIEGVGFLDAVRLLADRAGIEIREAGADPESDRKGALLAALRFAAAFYFRQLATDAGARGLAYLQERGFTKEAVKAFGIGVAPPGWDALTLSATEAGFKPDVLEAVGLAKARAGGGGHYDVFRDRLMFPILSPIGKVLGFGGRILPDTPTASDDYTPAKYINTPETEVYHKGRVLYGMKQAKRAIRTEREAIVVEGYADVVSLWQAGVQNVVAASGTALTESQMESLKRMGVNQLALVMDTDVAGKNSAIKAIDIALSVGVSPYVLLMDTGQDPDVFIQKVGLAGWKKHLAEGKLNFVEYLVLVQKRNLMYDSPESTSEAVSYLVKRVSLIRDEVAAESYYRFLTAELSDLGVDEVVVRNLIGKEYNRRFSARPTTRRSSRLRPEPPVEEEAPPAPAVVVVRPEEAALVRLMLQHGAPMVEHVLTRMGVEEFTPGPAREVVEALIEQFQSSAIDAAPFVRGDHGEGARGLVAEALAERHSLSDNWEHKVGVTVPERDGEPFAAATSAMRLLKLDRVQEAIADAMRRVEAHERAGESVAEVQAEVNGLNDLRRKIERGEFMEWEG